MNWWIDSFSGDPKLGALIIIIICLVCVTMIGCLGACLCRRRNYRWGYWTEPCVKCQLIDMGEMACYTGLCPGCGRVPPSLAAVSVPGTREHV